MTHACGPYTVAGFLEGRPPAAIVLWDRLIAEMLSIGPFEYAPAKRRVALMRRVRFLAVTALSGRGMTFHIWLRQRRDSPRFFRIDELGPRAVIHWVRITSSEDFDDELRSALRDAYEVGAG